METDSNLSFKVFRISDNAIIPDRKSSSAAGYDLYSAYDFLIPPNRVGIIPTDIAMAIPEGYYGRIAPRSSLATKFTNVGGGVVDSDYRGNIKVVIFNHSPSDELKVLKGDRIAQIILQKIATPDAIEVDSLEKLSTTDRGVGGFGSTGK